MGSTKTSICFSLALLSAAFVLSAAHAPSSVSPFCGKALDKNLCTELVKGGRTWEEAMTNAIEGAIDRVTARKQVVDEIPLRIPAIVDPQLKEDIAQTCKDAYQGVVDSYEESIMLVKDDPTCALKNRLSTGFSECYDDISGDHGAPLPEARKFGEEINVIGDALLSVLQKKP